jgi:alcohol dehydrogenase (cytochrome c)
MRLLLALLPALALAQINLPFERIRDAHKEPSNWLTYSGSYNGHRYSLLDQIDTKNVGTLRVAWVHQKEGESDAFETSAVVVDGVMFITEPPNIG